MILKIIKDYSYALRCKHVSDEKTSEFKYTLIHSTPIAGIRYKYSSLNNKGQFGIPKVIFGESGINHVIIDIKGEYGIADSAMAIIIENQEEGEILKKALLSNEFKLLLKSCMWANFGIEWNLFKYFKKDFWKEL